MAEPVAAYASMRNALLRVLLCLVFKVIYTDVYTVNEVAWPALRTRELASGKSDFVDLHPHPFVTKKLRRVSYVDDHWRQVMSGPRASASALHAPLRARMV